MKKKIIMIGACIVIAISILFFVKLYKNKFGSGKGSLPNENKEKIEQISRDLGYTADTDMYEITTEYDGREVVIIKPSIEYQVALAGAIKEGQPQFDELDEILENGPKSYGIWIEKSSREKFLQILKGVTESDYTINDDGYLFQVEKEHANKYDEKIKKMLEKECLYVFDISSICYIVDDVTGKIEEYPFEEMDAYQAFEYFETDDKLLFVITSNKDGKLKYTDIVKEILDNINI